MYLNISNMNAIIKYPFGKPTINIRLQIYIYIYIYIYNLYIIYILKDMNITSLHVYT